MIRFWPRRRTDADVKARSLRSQPAAAAGRPLWSHGTSALNGLLMPHTNRVSSVEEVRRSLLIQDRAIGDVVQLCGTIEFEGSSAAVRDAEEWARTVQLNQLGRGLDLFLHAHLVAMLLFGR